MGVSARRCRAVMSEPRRKAVMAGMWRAVLGVVRAVVSAEGREGSAAARAGRASFDRLMRARRWRRIIDGLDWKSTTMTMSGGALQYYARGRLSCRLIRSVELRFLRTRSGRSEGWQG